MSLPPSSAERWFNGAAGLSALSWAVLGVTGFPWSVPRCCLTVLHLVTGSLFLGRQSQIRGASPAVIAACLPSFIVGGVAFSSAPAPTTWPFSAQALFVVGTAATVVALLSLGRSFALLPALRSLVSTGPYGFIRHPAYAGELILVVACAAAGATAFHGLLVVIAVTTMVMRIEAEEAFLLRDEAYAAYAARVRWRLLLGVY